MKTLFAAILALGLFCCLQLPALAQEQPAQEQVAQQPSAEELEKQKAEREKNAYRLLEQVIDEAQSLKLTENRVRVQINAADMLWDQNQGRARGLFAMAGEGVAELGRTSTNTNRRGGPGQNPGEFFVNGFAGPPNLRVFQLRQELVLAAARHDAALAYQLLAATKPPAPAQNANDPRTPRMQFGTEDSLEQTLLGAIAARDPKLAAQNAEQMMEKGQFPRTLAEVIRQLGRQDSEAADKLADRTVRRIQSANILTNNDAAMLAQSLISPGPRPPASDTTDSTPKAAVQGRAPVLPQSTYVDLLSSVIDAALKVSFTSQNNNQRGAANPRVRAVGSGIGTSVASQPTDTQIEQANARRLLAGLQSALPIIDQYLPSKASQVRQKMSEMGLGNNSLANFAQTMSGLQGSPTADALVQAAAVAPQQMQTRLYQQAAYRALDEGDTERARQIANDHLQDNARDAVMQRIDFKEMAKKAEGTRIEEIRQTLARFPSESDKIDFLIQVAGETPKTNPKLAVQLLEEAKQITNHRAIGYQDFEQQLKVAHAFADVDPARSFEVLEVGIGQLNELLAAAAVLSGFEINIFRDGEMAIQGGNGLTAMINRYGQELAVLARSDFERSETLSGRFQFAEPRIMTRMAIVQGVLGVKAVGPTRMTVLGGAGNNVIIRQD
ncbi:MAG TPA: hypothetical protein VJ875_11275 [Pyrinomonadaceae bacterium]|nr:hypothetical protein [Pyrinomonadaceae bacterium]